MISVLQLGSKAAASCMSNCCSDLMHFVAMLKLSACQTRTFHMFMKNNIQRATFGLTGIKRTSILYNRGLFKETALVDFLHLKMNDRI